MALFKYYYTTNRKFLKKSYNMICLYTNHNIYLLQIIKFIINEVLFLKKYPGTNSYHIDPRHKSVYLQIGVKKIISRKFKKIKMRGGS